MIVLSKLSQLDAAREKAAEMNPSLRVIDFGVYQVSGSRGNWYDVRCWKNEHGQRFAHCSCEDQGRRRANVACFHLVPAIGAHILLAIAKRANARILYGVSGAPDKGGKE